MSRKIFENEIRKIALVVLPYAGGSSQSFSDWHSKLEDTITLNVLDYGGHGRRIKDSLPENFDEMVSDIEIQLQNISNESTFLFGHSMGGLVCAYAAANMYNKFGVKYAGIIISCCMAPEHFSIKNEMVWSDEKLINYLKIVRNVPLEVIESKEFRRFILPAIKNDFCILNDFQFRSLRLPPCPIHCIWAEQDFDIGKNKMEGWQKYASAPIKWHSISGSHFYFEEYPIKTFNMLNEIIQSN